MCLALGNNLALDQLAGRNATLGYFSLSFFGNSKITGKMKRGKKGVQ
jgi:hypothetical protein